MSGLKLASVGVLAFVVLGSMMVPAGAIRGQVLAGQAAQTIGQASGDPANAIKSGMNARDKARAASEESKKRADELEELTRDDTQTGPKAGYGGKGEEIYSAGEIVGAYQVNPEMAEGDFVGKRVVVEGVIVDIRAENGGTLVKLMPANPTKTSPPFIVRFAGENTEFEKGTPAKFEGTFVGMFKREGKETYVLDALGQEMTGPREGNMPSDVVEEKVAFEGWRFTGSVETGSGATGVFTRGDELLFAQPGDRLSDGVKVVSMKAGEVVLEEDDRESVLVAW